MQHDYELNAILVSKFTEPSKGVISVVVDSQHLPKS